MYSRHFYHIEDVCAGLQYAIHNERLCEALFWTNELINVDKTDELKRTLFLSWFYSIGLSNLNIIDIIKNPTYESIYQMASYNKRNSTLAYMLLNGTLKKTYKVKKSLAKLAKSLQQDNVEIEYWIRRTLVDKYLESWQLSLNIWDEDNFDSMLQEVVIAKFEQADKLLELIETIYNFDFVNIIYRKCAIIGILCMNDNNIKTALKPLSIVLKDEIKFYLEEYKLYYGKRYARIYKLEEYSFYGKTKRGKMKKSESNISELYDSDTLIKNQSIYTYIISVFKSFDKFKDNTDEYEKFYNKYFPDDIPEEWSLVEQAKSHGNGILDEDEKPSIKKYFTIWTKGESFIDNTEEILNEALKKRYTYDFEKDILESY